MNKKLHLFLFCLLLIFIVCSCKDKLFKLIEPYGGSSGGLMGSIIEPFGNQIVIHPDTAELNPRETTFSILTYDSDLGSGITQASICSDDSSWRNGDKTCRNYSLDGTNCEDIGDDGRLAFDACKVACDNCNTYTEVKRRLPSPIEDTDEPSYSQFESSASGGDFGSVGGVDIREILDKLEELDRKIDLIDDGGIVPTEAEPEPEVEAKLEAEAAAEPQAEADSEAEPEAGPEVEAEPEAEPEEESRTGYCSGNTTPANNFNCVGGYSDKVNKSDTVGNTNEVCCDKTGFCSGNDNGLKDIECPFFYSDIENKSEQIGRSKDKCCKSHVLWGVVSFIIIIFGLSLFYIGKNNENEVIKRLIFFAGIVILIFGFIMLAS